jgi:hypothetical protein
VEDSVSELRLKGCLRHEIDRMTDDFAKLALKPDKLEETNRPIELDKQIDVTVRSALITGERPEQ